ncbi:MAG: flagellar assembly protein A [Bacillota bacterium]
MDKCRIALSIDLPLPQIDKELQQVADMLLATLDMRDNTTGQHSRNVAKYAMAAGTALGLSQEDVKTLYIVGIFHDVGKFGIAENVLFKPGKLNKEETDQVRTHSTRSADIVRSISSIKELANIVECHHERYDGTGYPHGLKGEEIPLMSRILSVADAFDAMTTQRCYKKSLCLEDAVKELRSMIFSQFDPAVVEMFVQWLTDQGFLENACRTTQGPQENKKAEGGYGTAWVQGGCIMIKDPAPGFPKAAIIPCPEVSLFINGAEVQQSIEVNSKDQIKIETISHKEPGFVKIRLSQDKLQAFLEIKSENHISYQLEDVDPGTKLQLSVRKKSTKSCPATFAEILKLLEKQGITYGIDYNVIKQLVDFPYDGTVEVAKGQAPTAPLDGKIELFFQETIRNFENADENTNIDFKEINKLPTVTIGDPLALNCDPRHGMPGKDVTGGILKPKEPLYYKLLAGKGVEIVEKGTKAIAAIEGLPKVKRSGINWTVSVDSLLFHKGDVNMGTGNIRFKGNVHIAGCVDNGMSVSATGDIVVGSLVTGAKVTAGSNLSVKGNVVNCELIAGGFVVLSKAIQPLLSQLCQYLLEAYGFAEASFNRIAINKPIRIGNILTYMKERNFNRQLTFAETINKKLKEYDLKLLGTHEELLMGAITRLCGINLLNFNTPEDFRTVIDNIKTVLGYIESTTATEGTVKIACALNSSIKSSGPVHIVGPGCFNTEIISDSSVVVSGVFRGGNIRAGDHAHIYEAGSEMGTKTLIAVPDGKSIKIDRANPGVSIQIGKKSKVLNDKMTGVELYADDDNQIKIKCS